MRISVVIPSLGRNTLKACVESLKDADEIVVVDEPKICCVDAYNLGCNRSGGDVILQTNDHIVFKDGWREKTEKLLSTVDVVSFFRNTVLAGCVKRSYLKKYAGGYLFWPEYIHYWCDTEMGEVARKNRTYTELLDYANILPKTGGMGFISPEFDEWDKDMWHRRTSLNFPMEDPDLTKRNKLVYG